MRIDDHAAFGAHSLACPRPVPTLLPSLLHRTRTGILALLLVVLPLQSMGQLVAGIQAHRHLHTGTATTARADFALARLGAALRAVLDQLHAAQDPRLQVAKHAWLPSRGPAAGVHAHGGVFHQHSQDTDDVLDLADPADGSRQVAATAFLAWLPDALTVPAPAAGLEAPPATGIDWRDHAVAPPLAPPRG